jgi:hypothetical protein
MEITNSPSRGQRLFERRIHRKMNGRKKYIWTSNGRLQRVPNALERF